MAEHYDVIVVGGGPAGSTTAALLAKKGYAVLVIEQTKFPRYHIGESMVTGLLPVLEELGLTETVIRHGFVKKYGGTLVWGHNREPWSFDFGEVGPFEHSFQVVRSEFDYLLLQHARHSGAQVLEETRVTDFLFEDGRCTGVTYMNQGTTGTIAHANFVVDASGQSALLARKLGLLEWDDGLKNVAIWAYYQGGKTLEGKNAGNILIENGPNGWLWVIPLHDGTQSVGWVTPAEQVNGRRSLEETFLQMVDTSVETRKLLASAQRTSAFHTARDWSYKSKQFYGPGFLLVGDAAGFVDPLFSSGVFLAMNGGSMASKAIEAILKEPKRESDLQVLYEKLYKDFLDTTFSFIHYFYDVSKQKESYWERAQELVDPIKQMGSRQDFIYLISGLVGVHSVMKLDPLQALTQLSKTATDDDHAQALESVRQAREKKLQSQGK